MPWQNDGRTGIDVRLDQTAFCTGSSCRPVFVIVVHHIVLASAFATISAVSTPIIDDIVSVVHPFLRHRGRITQAGTLPTVETWVSAVVMNEQVVVVGDILATPDASVTVRTFVVNGISE